MSSYRFRGGNKKRFYWLAGLWLAGSILAGIGAPVVRAQEEASEAEEPQSVPRVGLAELSGTPGASLMLPFYFTPDPDRPVRALEVDIDFISNSLNFQKASMGLAAEQVNAEIQTSVTDAEPNENGLVRSTLRLSVTVPDSAAAEGLPDGLLAYLLFQISLEAKPFSIRMNPQVVSAQDNGNPPQQIADIASDPGLITIGLLDVMPEATCFFFSH